MVNIDRRAFLGASVGAIVGTAGCQSTPELDTAVNLGAIASTEAPSGGQPLPTPVAGDPEASVTVEVYEDYACGHCATYSSNVFPEIAGDYLQDNTIRYEFHDFPIPVDDAISREAANAARKVQDELGAQAYFEYSELLFKNQSALSPDAYATLAEPFDINAEQVATSATQEQYSETVSNDRALGEEEGVQGTPAVFVDGRRVQWQEISYEPVETAINNALQN